MLAPHPIRRLLPRAALLFAALTAALPTTGATAHAVSCARADGEGGDWPQFGNQITGNRTQPREFILDALKVAQLAPAWTFDANRYTHMQNNEVTGYPVEKDGCVYVGSSTGDGTSGNALPGWVFAINADNGDLVWKTQVEGGVYATVAVDGGKVYAFVSHVGAPHVVALDQTDGHVVWDTTVDHQPGSDAVSSPVVFDGMVWVGISGTAAETDAADRLAFQGSTVLLDAADGHQLAKAYSVPPDKWEQGYAGGAQWGTIAIDPETKYGYEGTGNPFDYDKEYITTNAVLKIDLDRARSTFGQVVGAYKGNVEAYQNGFADQLAGPCRAVSDLNGVFAFGLQCAHLDLDFGAQPNIYRDATGRKVVAVGQKSGVLHIFDAGTMQGLHQTVLGVPSAVGGIVGSAAYDGTTLYGPHTVGGYLWAADATSGAARWLSPVGDGIHWGPPVTYANHILYTIDLKGFLDAYDSGTGAPLLHRPLQLGSDLYTLTNPPLSWGGVTVARHTVFASVGVGITSAGLPSMPDGFVVAFRPFQAPQP
jgi:polyvinyl alcohol dehydrogenase (cytochrome)